MQGPAATSRLSEERARTRLERMLASATAAAIAAVDALQARLGDVVTYGGRPYRFVRDYAARKIKYLGGGYLKCQSVSLLHTLTGQ